MRRIAPIKYGLILLSLLVLFQSKSSIAGLYDMVLEAINKHTVSLLFYDPQERGGYLCFGSLINETTVLTAKHCSEHNFTRITISYPDGVIRVFKKEDIKLTKHSKYDLELIGVSSPYKIEQINFGQVNDPVFWSHRKEIGRIEKIDLDSGEIGKYIDGGLVELGYSFETTNPDPLLIRAGKNNPADYEKRLFSFWEIDGKALKSSSEVREGDSGSGVFDIFGNVVGVLIGILNCKINDEILKAGCPISSYKSSSFLVFDSEILEFIRNEIGK